ncbi:interleukin-22 [Mixophyes fleayi]|uniref:interleukin-22 n=1 Tax=Mixophyes fleayi TaxID=3061075 RepID=UPI003F4D9391
MQYFTACWFLLYNYFPGLLLGIPLNNEKNSVMAKQSHCTLKQSYFLQPVMRRNIFSLAEQARLLDRDTDNKIFGSYIFLNISENDHCFLMRKIVRYIMENMIFDGFDQNYEHMEDAITFLGIVDRGLAKCKSKNEEQVNRNIEVINNKIKMLGPDGKNKAIGELDLLFHGLKKCAFQEQKL